MSIYGLCLRFSINVSIYPCRNQCMFFNINFSIYFSACQSFDCVFLFLFMQVFVASTCTCISVSNFLPVSLRLFQFLFIHLAWFICRYGPGLLDTGSALLQCLVTRIIHTLHGLAAAPSNAWDKIQVLLKSKRTTVEQWWKQVYPLFPQQNL